MLRNVVFFILSSPYYLAAAHPQCHYDEREVDLKTEMTFCSMEYAASGVCCTDLEEAALKETFTAASDGLTAECADYYKQVDILHKLISCTDSQRGVLASRSHSTVATKNEVYCVEVQKCSHLS